MTGEEATIDPKDITYDILIDDTEERPDRGGPEAAAGGPAKPQGDHPVVTVLDMAMKHSGGYLQKQNLPPPNVDVYKDFSKPFLNEAAWHYLPDGTLPDDPRLALALGVGGLALAFAPTLLALYQKQEEEKKREEQEKKRKKERRTEENDEREEKEKRGEEKWERVEVGRIKNPVTGKEYPVMKRSQASSEPVPGPVAEPPDWMTRLESGGLLGM